MNDQYGDGWPAFELDDLPDISDVGGTPNPIGLRGEEGSEATVVARRFGAFFSGDDFVPTTDLGPVAQEPTIAGRSGAGRRRAAGTDVKGSAPKMSQMPSRAFDAPPSVIFERLLPKYERRFGAVLPGQSADVEEVNRLMREALAPHADTPLPERTARPAS